MLFLLYLRYPNFRVPELLFSWRHQISKEETKSILLNNLESKLSLVMKVGKFMSYYKRKIFIKKKRKKNMAWKLVPGPFLFLKNPL